MADGVPQTVKKNISVSKSMIVSPGAAVILTSMKTTNIVALELLSVNDSTKKTFTIDRAAVGPTYLKILLPLR